MSDEVEAGCGNTFRDLDIHDAALKHVKGTLAALLVKQGAGNIDLLRSMPIRKLIRLLERFGRVELTVEFTPKD